MKYLFLFFTFLSQAQITISFSDIQYNESRLSVQKKLNAIANDVSVVYITTPNFPMAQNKKEHLIASKVDFDNGTLDKVVFTFSDDRLSYVQAKGDIVKALTPNHKK